MYLNDNERMWLTYASDYFIIINNKEDMGVIIMLTAERHRLILNLLEEKEVITLQDITEKTLVSESTIRRDLVELEEKRQLVRVHGGATLPIRNSIELTYTEKSIKNVQEKKAIAKFASELIEVDDCIFLDAGSTIFELVPFLTGKNIVVVTNGLTHVDELVKYEVDTYVIGGSIKGKTRALIGSQAIHALEMYRFDKCFLGVNSFHPELGYTTPDPEEATVKIKASSLAKETYVLADASKYNQISFSKIIDMKAATLITTKLTKDALKQLQKITTVKEMII